MGVIVRKSAKNLFITYIGLAIGYINTLILYPYILTETEIGLIRILISVSFLFATFASLGSFSMPGKFFFYFQDDSNQHSGFLFFLIIWSLVGFSLFSIVFLLFKDIIVNIYIKTSPLLIQYYYYFIPFVFIALFIGIFKSYIIIQKRPVVPTFINEVFFRLFIVIGLIIFLMKLFNLNALISFIIISYGLGLIILILYTKSIKSLFLKPNFSIFKSKYFKELLTFSGFMLFGSAGSLLISNIDGLMLSAYKGLAQTGIYTIAFFIATVIEIPKRSLVQSVIPFVSESNKNEDFKHLDLLYKKSSINQLIIGSLIFIGIWSNINNLFNLMPHGNIYSAGKWVVFYIGLSKLFDLATGVNAEIIGTSKYYKYNLVFMMMLGILAIITNVIFIPKYGMTGAAFASALSIFLFNVIVFSFLLIKMRIQPFTLNTIKVLVICGLTYFLNYIIPQQYNILLDIALRSLLIFIFFIGLIILTKSSEDINAALIKMIRGFREFIK
jgi:O-antigen/teichoic acid export membrane protein